MLRVDLPWMKSQFPKLFHCSNFDFSLLFFHSFLFAWHPIFIYRFNKQISKLWICQEENLSLIKDHCLTALGLCAHLPVYNGRTGQGGGEREVVDSWWFHPYHLPSFQQRALVNLCIAQNLQLPLLLTFLARLPQSANGESTFVQTLNLSNQYLCAIWFKLLQAFELLPYTASLAHMPIYLFLLWIVEWRNFIKWIWSWFSTLLQTSIGYNINRSKPEICHFYKFARIYKFLLFQTISLPLSLLIQDL